MVWVEPYAEESSFLFFLPPRRSTRKIRSSVEKFRGTGEGITRTYLSFLRSNANFYVQRLRIHIYNISIETRERRMRNVEDGVGMHVMAGASGGTETKRKRKERRREGGGGSGTRVNCRGNGLSRENTRHL